MKLRKEKVLWNVLLGTSVYLLDSLRGRLNEGIDDLSGRARDTYDEASRRAERAVEVVRRKDHNAMNSTAALLLGLGVGVSVGMLLAPASGRGTRTQISNRVREFGGRVRDKFASEKREPGTGTYGG